jgi:hypothetical protein
MLRSIVTFLVFASLAVTPAFGQGRNVSTGKIEGKLVLPGGGPAVGANVLLRDTRIGTSVGEDGTFVLVGLQPGTYVVMASLVGYELVAPATVNVRAGETIRVELQLRPEALELGAITVTGTRRQDAEDTRSSVTSLSPRESKILPGAAEDVLRSLQAVPGVTSVNDFSSQLVVRGSGPDQNLILIDGFEALNPYRLYGFISMFNPETISDISLQTGGFAAQYGDRLSAVLDVRNREGKPDVSIGGKLNLSLTNLNIILEGRLPLAGASYLFSARRTYYDLILGPVLKSTGIVKGDVALPNFRDFQGKLAVPISSQHKLLFIGFTSRDGAEVVSGVDRARPDSVNVFDKSYNTLLGTTWQYTPGDNIVLSTRLSWYRNTGDGIFDGTFIDPAQNSGDIGREDTVGLRFVSFGVDYSYRYEKTSIGQQILWDAGVQTIEAGFGVDFLRTDFTRYFKLDEAFRQVVESRGQVVPTDVTESVRYQRYNAYVQDRFRIGERLFVQPGIRLDVYPVLEKTLAVAPRLNLSYRISDLTTLRAAFGAFYQSPGMEKWDFRSPLVYTRETFAGVVPERADHYILGLDRMLSPEWQLKLDTYYKSLSSVIVPQRLQGTTWSSTQEGSDPRSPGSWAQPALVAVDSATSIPVNDARGYSTGFEVLLQKIRNLPTDLFTGWFGYALSYSERDRDGVRSPFQFDQRHALTLVGNYRFAERWDIGAKVTLRSGRPYADATGVQPRVVVATVNGSQVPMIESDASGKTILDVVYETDRYSGRMNLYHTLDVRLTTYPRWFDLDWAVYLDVQNVYNRGNEQAVSFYIDDAGNLQRRPIYGLPIFPSLGMSLVF